MNQQPYEHQPDIDTKLLSDFIHELNIARRQLSLYPPGHPQIVDSSTNTLQLFDKLCEFRQSITLGVAPDSLLFNQAWLDEKNPVYRDFAGFLSELGIAALTLYRGLTSEELIRFNQLLRADRATIDDTGGFPELLYQQQIEHIHIATVDYDAFSTSEELGDSSQNPELLWDDFLQNLLQGTLDPGGRKTEFSDRFDPKTIAELLNQQPLDKKIDYDQVIDSFVAHHKQSSQTDLQGTDKRFGSLLQNLNPELRRRFLNSTFRALDRNPQNAPALLDGFSPDLLMETLEQQSRNQLNISSRLVDLLGKFSTEQAPNQDHLVKNVGSKLSDQIAQSRIETLFNEDNTSEYLPDDYQHALQNILDGRVTSSVPDSEAKTLKATLEKQSVERQCCAIIFELLDRRLESELEKALQENLAELSRYFLDTGDFIALRTIFLRWSDFLYSSRSNSRYLDEKVLAIHTQELFMSEVLVGLQVWGEEKYQEISDYIIEVGEPYCDLLIHFLGEEDQMTHRRIYLKVLIEMGTQVQPMLLEAIEDERWYLVRNALIILDQQNHKLPLKRLQQLIDHPHPKVRQVVLKILFRQNQATARRLLLKELSSDAPEVLIMAVSLADKCPDTEVVRKLHSILRSDKFSAVELELKQKTLQALARIGDKRSLPELSNLLESSSLIHPKRYRRFRLDIIRTLISYPYKETVPLLRKLANSRNQQHADIAKQLLRNRKGPKS